MPLFAPSKNFALILLLAVIALLNGSPQIAHAQSDAEEEGPRFDDQIEHRGIEIDVRVGARRSLISLAIPDTIQAGSGDDLAAAATEVESILRRNLELVGYFRILPEDSFFFDTDAEGLSIADIQFTNWFNVGAQGLIKSQVRQNGDQFTLDLRLFGVEQGHRVELDWTPQPIPKEGIRPQVNAFINAVLEHYTGEKGVLGSRIAFAQRQAGGAKHIYTMEIDGSDRKRISTFDGINLLPTFGPEGRVYFTSYRDGNPDLFVHQNGSLKKLSAQPGQNSGAAFCGGKLAITLSRGTENTDVYLIDPNTGAVTKRLTDHWAIDVSPTWSPDCKKIAFVSGRSGGAHIFVMNADGSDQRRLTFQGTYNTTPKWSPAGDRIVFSGRDERNAYDIFTVDLDGNIERLTQDQGNNYEPSFSPDGRYILFTSDRGGQGKRIWMMTRDGQVQRQLTTGGRDYEEPAWEN